MTREIGGLRALGLSLALVVGCGEDSSEEQQTGSSEESGASTSDASSTTSASSTSGPGATDDDGADSSAGSDTSSTTSAESSSETTTGEPSLEERIEGTWTSAACESAPDGNGGTLYFTRTFELTLDTWAIDFRTFGAEGCDPSSQLFVAEIGGPYTIGDASTEVDGAFEGYFAFETRTITPLSEGAVGFLESIAACGISEWTLDEAEDVQESGCSALGLYPLEQCMGEYDLLALEGEELFFGARPADGNLCTEDRRPTELGAPLVRAR